ncbi:cation:proton antiporter [Novosphingobium sp. AAP93]|uniref:cation:proton antiporter domain-containing protein n=1 Tax=Novosphingobium sp. AAP93 TaxID=1523427 RepID=UPI0006B9A4E8|nr:cation:proton antiporter [Novosphingobium sp. AAP93]KPF79526.1 sodium:proton exchanger [Novosphingobium sp. AAP93]
MAGHLEFNTSMSDTLVVLGAAGIVIPAFARARITPVIGFILVGVLVGPFGLGRLVGQFPQLYYVTISRPEAIAPFAELGVILLLFEIGLELSFGRLWDMRAQVFGLGAAKLLLCAALLTIVLIAMRHNVPASAGLGIALALSSTALVLPIAGTQSPVGRKALAMLLLEDIALVPIIFVLGAFGPGGESGAALFDTLLRGAVIILVMLTLGRFLLPRLFASAARTKSPELFLAFSLLVVIAAALATAGAGLSPIMGALLAGLLIAETDYSREVEALTAPFKGLALGVFLITVGMGIDVTEVWRQFGAIALGVASVLAAKAVVTALLLRVGGASRGIAVETGLLLAAPSETTLIVLSAAAAAGLVSHANAQFWQIVTALGLTLTPVLAMIGRRLATAVDRPSDVPVNAAPSDATGQALILGYGRVGRLVGAMLSRHDVPWLALDADPALVTQARGGGDPVIYGNVANAELLAKLHLDEARAVIVTMDEPVLVSRTVRRIRAAHPDLPIIVRARDAAHAAELYRVGASDAVPEALESSLQLSEAVLVDMGVAMGPVIASIHEMRDELRETIMRDGGLGQKPRLKAAGLRDR